MENEETDDCLGKFCLIALNFGAPNILDVIHLALKKKREIFGGILKGILFWVRGGIWVFPKIVGFPPKIIHGLIGFSIIFTIHFGGETPPIFGSTPILELLIVTIGQNFSKLPPKNLGRKRPHGYHGVPQVSFIFSGYNTPFFGGIETKPSCFILVVVQGYLYNILINYIFWNNVLCRHIMI